MSTPAQPELRTSRGRVVENARVSLKGGVSFDLRTDEAIAYLEGFAPGEAVELRVRGRVADVGDRSKLSVDGDNVLRFVVIAVDYIEGAPETLEDEQLELDGDDAS